MKKKLARALPNHWRGTVSSERMYLLKPSLWRFLKKFGLDYLDLYLVHFPAAFHRKEGAEKYSNDCSSFVYEYQILEDTWNAMEELIHAGLVGSIGISNYNQRQLKRFIRHCKVVPAINEVELSPHWLNPKLIEFYQSKKCYCWRLFAFRLSWLL